LFVISPRPACCAVSLQISRRRSVLASVCPSPRTLTPCRDKILMSRCLACRFLTPQYNSPTLLMSVSMLLGAAIMSLASARGGLPARPALRPRASALMVATSEPPPPTTSQDELWDERELWALEDAVPRYAVDAGRLVCWDRLALDVPELMTRSGEELRSCWFDPPTALQKGQLENAAAE
jgi:hypothetical protein